VADDLLEQPLEALEQRVERGRIGDEVRADEGLERRGVPVALAPEAPHLVEAALDPGPAVLAVLPDELRHEGRPRARDPGRSGRLPRAGCISAPARSSRTPDRTGSSVVRESLGILPRERRYEPPAPAAAPPGG
jgi:hypothetical protein